MLKVGITGGIGSGKSTLCQMFRELGAPVYDSDAKAKFIMANNESLKNEIIEAFGEDSFIGEELNRQYLANIVFTNSENLAILNSLVHPKVKLDFEEWCKKQDAPYVIMECAILFEAQFNLSVDRTICVLSPKPLRIGRVISRDGSTKESVEERISNQLSDEEIHALSDLSVVNFDLEDLEDAAKVFDKKFRYEAAKD
ncbi:MAG: dephospho-CoA kinase [Rikenellaceae bacterium]